MEPGEATAIEPAPSIAEEITALDMRRAGLLEDARSRIEGILGELSALCRLVGPLTRDDIPEGVLRRRRTKKPMRAPRAKKKTEEAANAGA